LDTRPASPLFRAALLYLSGRHFIGHRLELVNVVHALVAQTAYTPYTFTTLAGRRSIGALAGQGSPARFSFPYGVLLTEAETFLSRTLETTRMRECLWHLVNLGQANSGCIVYPADLHRVGAW
jgi:hypothetical protein